ncbi:DUF2764 family protein [Candidatus Omnitrophota bacterium]
MRQYYYLIASLPMLEFGMKTPFSHHDFLLLCQEQLSAQDMDIMRRVSLSTCEDIDEPSTALRGWKRFDRSLRNEIARSRSNNMAKDPAKYIRGEDSLNPFVAGLAQWAVNQESPLEAELALDRFRWEKLEELRKGHYFNIDYLITYAIELEILERWENINSEGGMQTLQALS